MEGGGLVVEDFGVSDGEGGCWPAEGGGVGRAWWGRRASRVSERNWVGGMAAPWAPPAAPRGRGKWGLPTVRFQVGMARGAR